MLQESFSKLIDNRITRQLKRCIVGSMAARRRPRAVLNRWYATLSEEAKSRFYVRYAKIFREDTVRFDAGEWTITFAGNDLKLPLRPLFSWLDWDNAVSILGHDIEIKQTYAALLVSDQRPALFLDVGANYGMHSALFLSAGIPIIAFEPNPSCFPCFQTVCELNGLSGRWEPVAVGNKNDTIELVYPEKETWLGSVSKDIVTTLKRRIGVIVEKAPMRKLDDYLNDIPRGLAILKIDVEGSELDVLRGASQVLSACKLRIIFESNEAKTRRDLYQLFERFGYFIYQLPWIPSRTSKRLGIDAFVTSPGHNFIAVTNDDWRTDLMM
jgi:FkbM family methyltransferase